MHATCRAALVTSLAGLAACAAGPGVTGRGGNGPIPLVATPGPTKTEAEFRQDDLRCRTQLVQLPQGNAAAAPSASARINPEGPYPTGVMYLRCMANAQNTIEPLSMQRPVYGYYEPYPVFVGVGYGYPWYYGYSFSNVGYYGQYGRRGYDGYFAGHRDRFSRR